MEENKLTPQQDKNISVLNSKVEWIKLGEVIRQCDERNTKNLKYPVVGINKDKCFMPTAANMEGVDTSKYKVISYNMFVFSGMQTGRDVCIRIGLYEEDTPALVSPAYTTFKIESSSILPEYFFIFFNRLESDRYGWFISDSSVRANLDWPRFLDINIPLPSLSEQRKVVNAWKALREIKEQNESKAKPLMQVCQSYIQELKHKYDSVEIGKFIQRHDEKNIENSINEVRSVSVSKKFNYTNAKVDKSKLCNYKIVHENEISFVQTTGNEKCLCAAINHLGFPIVVTSVNEVFSVDENYLLADYLHLYFCRKETDRYVRFHSWGSARETFTWNDMERFKIPLPPLSVQRAIVNIYNCANEAKRIAEEADRMSREICPALIQHIINN